MGGIFTAAGKDLRRYLRDWNAMLLWLGIPLVLGSILILATGGHSGPKPQALLLVADEDDSFLSRFLLAAMNQGSVSDTIRVEKVFQEAGRQRIGRDETTALLVIPEGFSDAVVKEKPTRLLLITNPAQRILPRIVEELLSIAVDGAFYIHRVAGPDLRDLVATPIGGQKTPSDMDIASRAISINQIMRKLERSAFPPVIELQTTVVKSDSDDGTPKRPLAFLFLPGILVLGLLFAAQGLSGDVWLERESGVLRRVVTTPLGVPRLLIGKLVAITAMQMLVGLVVLAAGMAYLGLPWQRLPVALLCAAAIGVMLTSMMLAIQVSATTRSGATLLAYAVVMPLMMFGGCMFPLEIMPRWMAALGRFTPNGWGIEQLKAILLGSGGPSFSLGGFSLLLLLSAVFLTVAAMRLNRGFARS
jgi:ABC-2 type transport system permease protein